MGVIVGVLEIPSANWQGNSQRHLHNARGESNNGSEARLCTDRDARAGIGFQVVNIIDRSDLLSSGEVYSGIVKSNPSSRRLTTVEGLQLARDGYMVS